MAYAYILKCVDNRFYIGSTKNLQQRLNAHNQGRCKFTKTRLPVKVIYQEEFDNLSGARARELQIKGWKSRFSIEKLIESTESRPYRLVV